MQIGQVLLGGSASAAPPASQTTLEAAQQFESLLLGQLLENTRFSEDEGSQAQGTMWSLAAQQFAQILSKNGGFGISKLVSDGLARKP